MRGTLHVHMRGSAVPHLGAELAILSGDVDDQFGTHTQTARPKLIMAV
jgi:hypothetical protein